jgi:hypothetical protein
MSWTLGGWFLGTWWLGLIGWVPWLILIFIVGRMVANRQFSWSSLLVGIGGFYVWARLTDIPSHVSEHTVYWLPGRTATSMTIFALIALASYVRFERLGAEVLPAKESGPLDPPATRSSIARGEPKNHFGWFALACISTVLALGAYEQAVMIPTMIFILGVWLRIQGFQTRFSFQIVFWGILLAYVVYRVQIIPVAPSGYQKQQFRHGPGLWIDIFNYVLPGLFGLFAALNSFSTGIFALLTDTVWTPVGWFFANVSAWVSIRRAIVKPLIALLLAVFAYLPMAFLKQFGHYHYLPAAMLTLFVITLFEAYWPLLVGAISPSAIQAPRRAERAPGSLPKL